MLRISRAFHAASTPRLKRLPGPSGSVYVDPAELLAQALPKETTTTSFSAENPPSEPLNCCGSGCARCVWDDYFDELTEWEEKVAELKKKGGEGRSIVKPPPVDPGLRAFAELQAKLNKKKQVGAEEGVDSRPEVERASSPKPNIRDYVKASKKERARAKHIDQA